MKNILWFTAFLLVVQNNIAQEKVEAKIDTKSKSAAWALTGQN